MGESGAAIVLGGVTGGMAFELAVALLAGIVALAFFVRHLRAQKKLDPDTSHSFRILDRREVTSDSADRPTLFLTFALPRSKDLPCGSHVKLSATIDGQKVERSYTPTRFDGNQCELLFRVYPEGKMTRHLYNLKVGDEVQIRGPTGIHRYGLDGPGTFRELRKRMKATRVGLVAGGTGITPMLQIANAVLQDPDDNTPLELIAFNSTPDDVMLYNRLNTIAQESDGQLKLNWVVSTERKQQPASLEEAPYPWPVMTDTHFFGRVSPEILKLHLPPPAEDTIICLCGPPAFNKAAKSALAELDHNNVLTW